MLALVLADGNRIRVVEQDVRGLEHRVREERDGDELLLVGLLLELRHPPQLAEAPDAREQPFALGVIGIVALDEERAAVRLETRGEEERGQREGRLAQILRVVRHRDRVQVDDADELLALVLRLHPVLNSPDVVAEVLRAGGLDAAENAHWTDKSILSSMAAVERLAIVGTGLIGASVGLAARAAGVGDVRGWDLDPAALAVAVEREAVDATESLGAAVSGAELVIVAAPVAALPGQVAAALEATSDGTTVSDVGSTKKPVTRAVSDARFIGGHPVCGSETHGPAHASGGLFRGATWFLTPDATTDPERYRMLHGFVASLGAVPVAVDPEAHDRLVALTSHLPHALANVLLNQAGASRVDGHEPLAAAGGSLRDMTRVAGANPRIWVDIFLDNAEALATALAEHRRRIEQVERALADGDAGFLARWIGEASDNRRRMLADAYEEPGTLQRIRVHVPDRPGVLAGITQALGAERINIEDFELQHLSRERGGTLTLLVGGEDEAERAAKILEAQGYNAVISPVLE